MAEESEKVVIRRLDQACFVDVVKLLLAWGWRVAVLLVASGGGLSVILDTVNKLA